MSDVSLYAIAKSSNAITPSAWRQLMAQVKLHPVVQAIDGYSPAAMYTVSISPVDNDNAVVQACIVSFIMPQSLRATMNQTAQQSLAEQTQVTLDAQSLYGSLFGNDGHETSAELTAFSIFWTKVALQAGVNSVALRVVGFDENQKVAASLAREYRSNRASTFGI